MSQQDDIRKLIEINNRRLQKLKEKQAFHGLSIPPEILLEIEDIEAKLKELKDIAEAQPDVRDTFVKFTQQIYLNEFNSLYKQLKEWKEVHHLLHEILRRFMFCYSYKLEMDRLLEESAQGQWEDTNILREIRKEWRNHNKPLLRHLKGFAETIQVIGEPCGESASGPPWFAQLWAKAAQVDEALLVNDISTLTEHLADFGQLVDTHLSLADYSLRDIIDQINVMRS